MTAGLLSWALLLAIPPGATAAEPRPEAMAFIVSARSGPWSQAKTWVGLFPFLFLHYVVRGTQLLQPCSLARIHEAAHDGPPLYERRGFCSQEDFFRAARPFIASSIGHVKELRP